MTLVAGCFLSPPISNYKIQMEARFSVFTNKTETHNSVSLRFSTRRAYRRFIFFFAFKTNIFRTRYDQKRIVAILRKTRLATGPVFQQDVCSCVTIFSNKTIAEAYCRHFHQQETQRCVLWRFSARMYLKRRIPAEFLSLIHI